MTQQPELGSAQNPGVTAYSYAYNATGLLTTRATPQANQTTNASATTTRTTQYDQIGRVLTQSYNDGITAAMTYTYDLNSVAGQSLTNSKGRLVASATNAAESLYSYDALGNVTSQFSCLPGHCPAMSFNQAFQYDLLGNPLSRSDANGTTYTSTYSPASELTSLSSSLVNSTHPASLIAGAQYGPFGITSRGLISGTTETYGYDARGRPTGSSVSRSGTVLSSDFAAYAPNGAVVSSTCTAQGNWQYG